VDPTTCNLNSICEFFADKLNEGKAANTIAGYRTAISEVHEMIDGQTVGSHPVISRAILAVKKENPPPGRTDDIIDISSSLTHIINLGDNETMSLRDLSMKTAFLIALVTASRPSDIFRMDLSTAVLSESSLSIDCVAPKEYNIALAHSTATSKKRVKKVFIGSYSENPLLCPFSALQSLLSRTSHFRTSSNRKKSIFLISRQPYTPATIDTIANWIKTIVQISSSNSSARDVRATSASLVQNAGADLSIVLALGNWTSNSTYQKFYQRGVSLMLAKNNVSQQILNEATSMNRC